MDKTSETYQDLEKMAMDTKKKKEDLDSVFRDLIPNRIWDMERNLPPGGTWISELQKRAEIACAIQNSLIQVIESDMIHGKRDRLAFALDDCLSIFEDVLKQLKEP